MKKILLLANLFLPFLLFAQDATNDGNKHYQVRTQRMYFETDCWDGLVPEDFPTFLIKTADDLDNDPTQLMTYQWNAASGEDHCLYWDADAPSNSYQYVNLRTETNTSNTKFDIDIQSYNDFPLTGTRCILQQGTFPFNIDDCANASTSWVVNAHYSSAADWNTRDLVLGGNNSRLDIQTAWRYVEGNSSGSPLTFGTINSGTKTDVNSNRGAPSNAESYLGYDNSWDSSWAFAEMTDARDVTYSFSTSGNAKKITISTDHSQTNYDTKIHLVRVFDGTIWYLGSDDDGGSGNKSLLTADLSPDDYQVVVEGYSTYTGDFKVTVNAVDAVVDPGSITPPAVTSICDGAAFPEMTNAALAGPSSAVTWDLGAVVYSWEQKIGSNSWISIAGTDVATLPSSPSRMMTMETTRFRRKATLSGNVAYSNEIVFTLNPGTVSPGSIALSGSNVIPSGVDPGFMQSDYDGLTVMIVFDDYPEETSWEITDNNAVVVASGGTYNLQPDGSTVIINTCLPNACYDFTILDSYGDGICCEYGIGSYSLTDNSGNILASGGTFLSSETTNFCLSGPICNGSSDDATGDPLPITYQWEFSINNGTTWNPAPNSTNSTSYDIPVLTETTLYRRVAINDCGSTAVTNQIEIEAIIPDGSITGKVSSPAGTGGPSAGVEGVTVTVTRTSSVPGEAFVPSSYSTTTDLQGNYTITDIYYGNDQAEFTIEASKIDGPVTHVFNPANYTNQVISTTFKNLTNKDFTDETVFTFSGTVYQQFNNILDPNDPPDYINCGMDTVGIWLNGVPVDSTESDGTYAITIPSIGNYTIEAKYNNHAFSPAIFDNFYVDSDNTNMDFQNIETHLVTGFAGGGCDTYLGQSSITFTSIDNCINRTITTNPGTGAYIVELPARKYNVQLVDFPNPSPYNDLVVEAFFNASQEIDLTYEDKTQDFIYRPPPVVRVTGMPAEVCGGTTALEQAIPYELTIEVFEGVLDGCPVDTGMIFITDEVGDLNDNVISMEFSDGVATYQLNPGVPNIIMPYLKNLTIVAQDTFDQFDTYTLDALVTGVRPREQTFTTVTPEIPFMILRDPPGDASYSYVEQTESMELATTFYALESGSVNAWADVKIGAQFEAGFLGFSTESEFWGQVGGSVEVSSTSTTTSEAILSVSTTETFSTSGNEEVTGTDGDVFVGAAMNMLYAVADIIEFDATTCQVSSDIDLVIKNDGFATTYVYTEQYIREVTIPQLAFLEEFTMDPDSAAFYADQINVWEQTLQRNETLKDNATFVENRSFSNNAPYESSTTTSTSESLTIEFNTEINTEVAVELGMEVAGSGISGGVVTSMKVEFGESTTGTTTSEFTTGYHLEDDDIGDGFTVDILTDPVYKTPVFNLISGISSCPYEDNTQPRDEPMLTAVNPIETNVNPAVEAEFTLLLKNTSQSGEDRTYYLGFDQASNPDGAEIKIGGSPYINPIPYYIPYLGTINVTVKVGMGAMNVFTYEGLAFSLYPDCDEDLGETVVLTTFFDSPCSDVALFAPIDDWVINENSDILNVHVKNYDKALLDQIQIQRTLVGASAWSTMQVLNLGDLNNNIPNGTNLGTEIPVNLANIADARYDLRLKLVCASNAVYSNRARGIIDRIAPKELGIPQPIDDHYDASANDMISIAFDEDIDCSASSVTLVDLNLGITHAATVACFGHQAVITPSVNLEAMGDALYQVNLSSVRDQYGNTKNNTSWIFSVGDYRAPESCGPIVIINNNPTYDAIDAGVYNGTTIQSAANVATGTAVNMEAAVSIDLKGGFEVLQGAEFTGEIKECPEGN